MKASWKENEQVVASEPQKETFTYEELKVGFFRVLYTAGYDS